MSCYHEACLEWWGLTFTFVEERRKEHDISSHSEALVTEKRGKSRKPHGDNNREEIV